MCSNTLCWIGKFLPIILVGILYSCSHPVKPSEIIEYAEFPAEKSLSAQTIVLDKALFRYPFRIRIQDSVAIVMDLHGTDYYYHVFHYPDFQYVSSFGRRGDSPVDMLSAENMRVTSKGEIWTLDANKSELTKFGGSSLLDSLARYETVSLDESILRALDFVVYDDSTFIVPDYSGENRFCWVTHEGKIKRKTEFIPTANKDALRHSSPALAQAWRSFLDYNPNNGVLATVTQLGEVIEIYNLKDSIYKSCIGEHGEPEFKISDGYGIPTGIMGFSDVQVTDSAIYAVFHGTSLKEIVRQRGKLPDGGKYIYVFSLNGKPLYKYVLDRNIYGIWVDEDSKTIIVTDVNNDQPIVLYRYG